MTENILNQTDQTKLRKNIKVRKRRSTLQCTVVYINCYWYLKTVWFVMFLFLINLSSSREKYYNEADERLGEGQLEVAKG